MNNQLDLFGNETPITNTPNKRRKETAKEVFRKINGFNDTDCINCINCLVDDSKMAYVKKYVCLKMPEKDNEIRSNEKGCNLYQENK